MKRLFSTSRADLALDRLAALAPALFMALGCAATCGLIAAAVAAWRAAS